MFAIAQNGILTSIRTLILNHSITHSFTHPLTFLNAFNHCIRLFYQRILRMYLIEVYARSALPSNRTFAIHP